MNCEKTLSFPGEKQKTIILKTRACWILAIPYGILNLNQGPLNIGSWAIHLKKIIVNYLLQMGVWTWMNDMKECERMIENTQNTILC